MVAGMRLQFIQARKRMRGNIFNIQKFCLHDGPGIRTTVFFKGCNLRCAWCANPESQQTELQLTLDREKCLACGRCVNICAPGAREIAQQKLYFYPEKCSGCGLCVSQCPVQAIGREGRNISAAEIAEEVMKDQAFYAHSGGGVTFSGGEVLMQREFASELAGMLRSRGIHVAIETAAAVPPDAFRAFISGIDYVLVDLKHYDDEAHRKATGVGNSQIIENIRILRGSGLDFMVRIPVIPGFNASVADAREFARLLDEMDIHEVQLLPFHQLGERKYALLDRKYDYACAAQLHREDLTQYASVFEEFGVRALY